MTALRHIRILLTVLTVNTALCHANAQDASAVPLRPVTSAYTASIGSSHRADTYLTPLRYAGWTAGVGYSRMQAMRFDPQRWVMALDADINLDRTLNPARNSTLWGADCDARWAMMRRYEIIPNLMAGIGGGATAEVGALYMARNGNNPVAATASLTLDATVYAAWNHHIGRLPITLLYRASLPVTGVFFTPDYAQLYYQIYMGDTHGNVSAANWGNYFRLSQSLTADLHFGATALRLGYACRVLSTSAHHLVTRHIEHALILGVATEWISLNPNKRANTDAQIISALY